MDLDRLAGIRTIDLTTFGRKSGRPRRIEIWWFHVDGRFVITGTPGRRDWLANVIANPEVIIHIDGDDLRGRATVIEDPEFKRHVFTLPATRWYSSMAELERLIETAPMIEIDIV